MITEILLSLPIIGGLSALQQGAIFVAIMYYSVPITIAIFILLFELMLKFDLAGSLANVANAIIKYGFNQSFSILPSANTKAVDADKQAELFRIESPINLFIHMNRAMLYMVFFLSLMTLLPFSLAFTFPVIIYVGILSMVNQIVIYYEPLFFGTILIFSSIDKVTDVMKDMIAFIKA